MRVKLNKYGLITLIAVISMGLTLSNCKEDEKDFEGEYIALALIANDLLGGQCMKVTKTVGSETYTARGINVPKGGCNIDVLQGRTRVDAVRINLTSFERQIKIADAALCVMAATNLRGKVANTNVGQVKGTLTAADLTPTEDDYLAVVNNTNYFPVANAADVLRPKFEAMQSGGTVPTALQIKLTSAQTAAIQILKTPAETDPFVVLAASIQQGGTGQVEPNGCLAALKAMHPVINQIPDVNLGATVTTFGNTEPAIPKLPSSSFSALGSPATTECTYGAAVATPTCTGLTATWVDGSALAALR